VTGTFAYSRFFLLLSLAVTATASPILVSGSGSFSYDGLDGGTDVSFSGSDGIHSVYVSVEQFDCCGSAPYGQFSPYLWFGYASVDGIGLVPGDFTRTVRFALGGGGFIAIYDSGQQVAYEAIAGVIQITSFNDPGCCGFYTRSGTFNIVPIPEVVSTPEPATFGLLGAGIVLIASRRGFQSAWHPRHCASVLKKISAVSKK
jgi:hypothetical protein